jgi:hypothetical protein
MASADLSTDPSLNCLGETDPSNQNKLSNPCYIILTEKLCNVHRSKAAVQRENPEYRKKIAYLHLHRS